MAGSASEVARSVTEEFIKRANYPEKQSGTLNVAL